MDVIGRVQAGRRIDDPGRFSIALNVLKVIGDFEIALTPTIPYTPAVAEALDEQDPLARFRDDFVLPPGSIYLCGNSLGPLPRSLPA